MTPFQRSLAFSVSLVIQTGIIFAIIAFKLATLPSGTELVMRIAPVDPNDPFRGDYLTFQYEERRVYTYGGKDAFQNGDTVYVPLYQQSNGYARINGALLSELPKDARENIVYAKATIVSGGRNPFEERVDYPCPPGRAYYDASVRCDAQGMPISSGSRTYTLSYGAEQFFIPDGIGRNLTLFGKEAAALIVVGQRGDVVLKQVLVDGKPFVEYAKRAQTSARR